MYNGLKQVHKAVRANMYRWRLNRSNQYAIYTREEMTFEIRREQAVTMVHRLS